MPLHRHRNQNGQPITEEEYHMTESVVKTQHNPVSISDNAGIGVVASIYNGDKTVASASSTREALATGVESVYVYNQGATNFMRFTFGDSTVVATIATGFFLDPGDSLSVPVPSGSTHWAYIADTADVTAAVVWGG